MKCIHDTIAYYSYIYFFLHRPHFSVADYYVMLETKELGIMDTEEEAKAVQEAEMVVADYFKNRHRVSSHQISIYVEDDARYTLPCLHG